MKHGILLCFALAVCLGTVFSGAEPAPVRGRGQVEAEAPQLEPIVAKLNLSRRQKLKIAKILKESKAAGDDREATLRKVAAVLSEDQKQTLLAELQAQRGKSQLQH